MGTAVTLKLVIRRDEDHLVIPRKTAEELIRQDAAKPGELGVLLTKALAEDTQITLGVHDRAHLEAIAHWRPEGGLPARDDAKWLGLRTRIAGLDTTHGGNFTINGSQAALLWSRLTDERFKIDRPTQAWSGFLRDYLLATGNTFQDVTAELLDISEPGA